MAQRVLLVGLFLLLSAIGVALLLLSGLGDASVVGSTGTIVGVLERHGLSENVGLRGDLFDILLRLRGPWSWVSNIAFAIILVSMIGVAATLRTAR